MNDRLRVVASRVAALLVGTACTFLLVHYKLAVPEALREAFEQLIAAGFVGGAAWLATHFGIAVRVNPDDAASPHAAAIGKAKQRARKQTRAIEQRLNDHGLRTRKPEIPYPTPADTPDEPPQLPPPHNHD
jgi:hypothetical protein